MRETETERIEREASEKAWLSRHYTLDSAGMIPRRENDQALPGSLEAAREQSERTVA